MFDRRWTIGRKLTLSVALLTLSSSSLILSCAALSTISNLAASAGCRRKQDRKRNCPFWDVRRHSRNFGRKRAGQIGYAILELDRYSGSSSQAQTVIDGNHLLRLSCNESL